LRRVKCGVSTNERKHLRANMRIGEQHHKDRLRLRLPHHNKRVD
jgi:hypothetical protein